MIVCYDNKVLTSTITSSTESLTNTFTTNLLDTRLSRRGMTTSISSQWIKFFNASYIEADYCIIMSHNLTSAATIYIEGNNTDVWTSPSFRKKINPYNLGYLTDEFGEIITDEFSQPITYLADFKNPLITQDVRFTNFTKASYKYWRLTVDDPVNTADHLEIGYVFIGDSLAMPYCENIIEFPINSTSGNDYSESGQMYGNKKLQYKSLGLNFNNISQSERNSIELMFYIMDKTTPWTLIIWEDSPEVEEPLYVNYTDDIAFKKNPGEGISYSMQIKVRECR